MADVAAGSTRGFCDASGRSVWLKDIVSYVFDKLKIDRSKIKINPQLFRPTDIEDIYGSSEKARKKLNWHYDMDFFAVLDKLIAEEEKNYGAQRP